MSERFGGDLGKLVAAVNQVMHKVSYIKETGKNTFHKYAYASDEDLLKALQPAMVEAGVVLVPLLMEQRVVEHSPDGKGKAQWRTELHATYLLAHTAGGWMYVQTVGTGLDGEDKGSFKAMTGALKYALRGTFLVPTGQDAERDRDDRKKETAEEKQARQDAHDPDWPNDRGWFMAKVTSSPQHEDPEKRGFGFKEQEFIDFLTFCKLPRPSAMTADQRRKTVKWLSTEACAKKLEEYLASTNDDGRG